MFFVENNPIKYSDPNGHTPVCAGAIIDGVCLNWAGLTGVNSAAGFENTTNDDEANAKIWAISRPVFSSTAGKAYRDWKNHCSVSLQEEYSNQPDTLTDTYEFTGFLEFDKLTGGGIRLNGTYFFLPPFFGVDGAFDFVSLGDNGFGIYLTLSFVGGVGVGGDLSVNGLAVYNATSLTDLTKKSVGAQVTAAKVLGANVAYSASDTPGLNGRHAQMWTIGGSGGVEIAVTGVASYSWLLFR